MKRINLWVEGYAATGNQSSAMFCGTYIAKDIQEAIYKYKQTVTDPYSRRCFNLDNNTFWGCRFFDNEKDARKSFG